MRNDFGVQVEFLHLCFLLFLHLAVRGFLVWKIWTGKNWARLTMIGWFLYSYIHYFTQLASGATPIQVALSLKVVSIVLAILQAFSLALLFTGPAKEWFRLDRTKESLLSPR